MACVWALKPLDLPVPYMHTGIYTDSLTHTGTKQLGFKDNKIQLLRRIDQMIF